MRYDDRMPPGWLPIEGLHIGQVEDRHRLTGCTVLLAPAGMVAACDVRGGAVGERELGTLELDHLVERIHGLLLTGGSAFGLAAADGVMQWCREQGIGFDAGSVKIPIVPAAVVFDLAARQGAYPDAEMGYRAAASAAAELREGNVGAGMGVTAGKLFGIGWATKTGVGAWTEELQTAVGEPVRVAALAVANPFGDIRDPDDGRLLAGTRNPQAPRRLVDTAAAMLRGRVRAGFAEPATVLAAVATTARLDRRACRRVAKMASAGLARALSPAFTSFDGDVTFTLSVGAVEADVHAVGVAAAQAVGRALARAATEAVAAGGLPAASDLERT